MEIKNKKFFRTIDLIIVILAVGLIIGIFIASSKIQAKEIEAYQAMIEARIANVDNFNAVIDEAITNGKSVDNVAVAVELLNEAGYDIEELTKKEPEVYYWESDSKHVFIFSSSYYRGSNTYPDVIFYDYIYLLDNKYYQVSTTIEDVMTNIDVIEVDDSDAYVIRLYGENLPANITISGVESFDYKQEYGFITVYGVTDNIIISAVQTENNN